jgi:hypothetical protein
MKSHEPTAGGGYLLRRDAQGVIRHDSRPTAAAPTTRRTGQPELVVQDADDAEEHRDREQRTQCSHERAAAVGARLRRIRGSLGHVSTCRSPRYESGRSS